MAACKPRGFRAITSDALREKDTQRDEAREKVGGERKKADRGDYIVLDRWQKSEQ